MHIYEDKERSVYLRSYNTEFMKIDHYHDDYSNKKQVLKLSINGVSEEFLSKDMKNFDRLIS